MLIKRRNFIQSSALATASLMVPRFLQAFDGGSKVPPGNKVLVVLQLNGGNDGLNTVIPYQNDIYYQLRPQIGIKKQKALALTPTAGIHPSLTFFKELYDKGELGILNNVGYPDQDRSHFRSMDIWESASNSREYWNTGWLGRYLQNQCKQCDHPTQIVELDDTLSLAMKGEEMNGFAFTEPSRLVKLGKSPLFDDLLSAHEREHAAHTASYLYKTLSETKQSAAYIYEKSRQFATGVYPSNSIGKKFKTISSLILSDINTKVYYISHGSFDTHSGQDNKQSGLFKQLNDALTAFVADMKKNNRFQDVLIMTFSEFGRRVKQNASGGTDHGSANNMFFLSGGLKKAGMLNEFDDLTKLYLGDQIYKVDFRQVYATVLQRWLKADPTAILQRKFSMLNFI